MIQLTSADTFTEDQPILLSVSAIIEVSIDRSLTHDATLIVLEGGSAFRVKESVSAVGRLIDEEEAKKSAT